MSRSRSNAVTGQLADERGRKIIFLSHCLLNENTRYQGGACSPGVFVPLIEELGKRDFGIVQMPCPEQLCWGGVSKHPMAFTYGLDQSFPFLRPFKGVMARAFSFYSKIRFRRIARGVVRIVRDYTRNGYTVVRVVGIDGSPTCGVNVHIDLSKALEYHASLTPDPLTRERYNRELYARTLCNGKGIFIEVLSHLLEKHRLKVPLFAHDLVAETENRHVRSMLLRASGFDQ